MTSRYFCNTFSESDDPSKIDENLYKSRILSHVETITANVKQHDHNCAKGLYTGTAGIAYALYYLQTSAHLQEHATELLQKAKMYINVALSKKGKRKPIGLLSGESGVLLVAAIIYNKLGERKEMQKCVQAYQDLATLCEPLSFLEGGCDELFVGRAGYLLGIKVLSAELRLEVFSNEKLDIILTKMYDSGRVCKEKMKLDINLPLMYTYHGKPYLGSAHGFGGILQVFLSFPSYLKRNSKINANIKTCVDFLLKKCIKNGNIATNLDGALSSEGKYLVHWCHGAAGLVYTFARAYLLWDKEQKYLDTCRILADTVWRQGLLKKGPGICHGVAGSGYVFLLLYRLTLEPHYLCRAQKFADFMFTQEFLTGARSPDRPYSLFEGLSGTVCFLTDLLQPTRAEFPLCNIFIDD